VAQAIIRFFDKQALSNQIYHVFNPYLFDMTVILRNNDFTILPIEIFIDRLSQNIQNGSHYDLIVKFLLHQGWLDWLDGRSSCFLNILQDKTQYFLEKLDFKWPVITEGTINKYLNSLGLIEMDKNHEK
jgi:hypothetical protein